MLNQILPIPLAASNTTYPETLQGTGSEAVKQPLPAPLPRRLFIPLIQLTDVEIPLGGTCTASQAAPPAGLKRPHPVTNTAPLSEVGAVTTICLQIHVFWAISSNSLPSETSAVQGK